MIRKFKRMLYLSNLPSVLKETNSYPMRGIGFVTNTVPVGHPIAIISVQLRAVMCLIIKIMLQSLY